MTVLMAVIWATSIFAVHWEEVFSYQSGTASWIRDSATASPIKPHLVTCPQKPVINIKCYFLRGCLIENDFVFRIFRTRGT